MLIISACIAGPAFAHRADDQQASYRILGPNGTVIGWQTEHHTNTDNVRHLRRQRHMKFTVDGHDPISTKTEISGTIDAAGVLISLNISSEINRKKQSFQIEVKDGTATITHLRNGKSRVHVAEYPTDTRFAETESLLTPATGTFAVFNTSTMGFQTLSNQSIDTGGAGISANIRSIDGSPVEIWLHEYDSTGALVNSTRPLLGSPIRFERLAADEESPRLSGSGRINHQLIPASYTISGDAKSGKIRYNFGLLEALVSIVPQTGEQAVIRTGTGLQMDICGDCGPGLPIDAVALARYTRPTIWLQSDAPVFRQRGGRMAKRRMSDSNKIRALGRIARGRLNAVDLNGHFSALDAWQNRAGDCTEDAVVLATLARASGIPALVASGIVYTRERYHGASNAFVPHSWVVAYADGKWQSFDYTLDGGFDSTHIALTIGEGDARSIAAATQIAAMLEWQSMAEIRSRPKP